MHLSTATVGCPHCQDQVPYEAGGLSPGQVYEINCPHCHRLFEIKPDLLAGANPGFFLTLNWIAVSSIVIWPVGIMLRFVIPEALYWLCCSTIFLSSSMVILAWVGHQGREKITPVVGSVINLIFIVMIVVYYISCVTVGCGR